MSVSSLGKGELLCLLASLLYALAILLTSRFSRREDPLLLGIVQVGSIGALALFSSLLLEQPRLPAGGSEWSMVLALALVCSGFGFTLQPVAQRQVPVERAGLFCALNPLTAAAALGTLFLGERLSFSGILGAGCIALGFLLRSLPEERPRISSRNSQFVH